jgi:hypothetical protein
MPLEQPRLRRSSVDDDMPLEQPILRRSSVDDDMPLEQPRLRRSSARRPEFMDSTTRNFEEDRRISTETAVRNLDEQLRRDVEVVREVLNAMEAIDNRDNRRSYLEQVMRNNIEYRNIVNSPFRRRLVEDEINRNVPTPDSYRSSSSIELRQNPGELYQLDSITGITGGKKRKRRKSRKNRKSRKRRKSLSRRRRG